MIYLLLPVILESAIPVFNRLLLPSKLSLDAFLERCSRVSVILAQVLHVKRPLLLQLVVPGFDLLFGTQLGRALSVGVVEDFSHFFASVKTTKQLADAVLLDVVHAFVPLESARLLLIG